MPCRDEAVPRREQDAPSLPRRDRFDQIGLLCRSLGNGRDEFRRRFALADADHQWDIRVPMSRHLAQEKRSRLAVSNLRPCLKKSIPYSVLLR